MHENTLIIYPAGFLRKYFERELADRKKGFTLLPFGEDEISIGEDVDSVVFISSTDVYGATEGVGILEGAITDPTNEQGKRNLGAERQLTELCASKSIPLTILRAPEAVGTGMEGRFMRMVKSIYRANYYHVADETAHLSVIHASDLARAAFDMAGQSGIFNITDTADPSLHDLAEAFAYRLAQKRIFTLSAKRARRWASLSKVLPFSPFTPKSLAERYRTLTFGAEKILDVLPWTPTPVTEYLRTHKYDENSL